MVHDALCAGRVGDVEDPHRRVVDEHLVVGRIRFHGILRLEDGASGGEYAHGDELSCGHELPCGFISMDELELRGVCAAAPARSRQTRAADNERWPCTSRS